MKGSGEVIVVDSDNGNRGWCEEMTGSGECDGV